jgi:MoaA/NifB/PqqE/SkfB family radical SAM enzyme
MQYDTEADWILLETCNFRCPYCFFPAATLGAKIKIYGTAAQWREGFKATGKTWLLHITGGEPSIYPGFVELCDELSQEHYLSINSNLSHPSIKAFARRIRPERVHFINAAVHWEQRQQRESLDIFIERVHELQDAKFNVLLSLIMTPHVLKNFSTISGHLETHGLFVIPKVIRGTYEGKHYPTSYSMEERRLTYEYLKAARQKYDTVLKNINEPPSINMFSDYLFLNGVKDYHGRLCSAGYRFVKITPEGNVVRCGLSTAFGNILLKNVRLWDAPKPCDTSYCPYFCEKYSVEPGSYFSRIKVRMIKVYYFIRADAFVRIVKKLARGTKITAAH